jgi:hypothetical protein
VQLLGSSPTPPRPDQFELSVFGPGFGECVVMHLGLNEWIIVDSCFNPDSAVPAALSYLRKLGVNPAEAVKLIVATHWHDDHIGGLANVFTECTKAKFCCPPLIRMAEFQALMSSWLPMRNSEGGSGVNELIEILGILESRATNTSYPHPIFASPNRVLLERLDPICASVRSLSPSDVALSALIARLTSINSFNKTERRRIPAPDENEASIALSIKIDNILVLLGADLEVKADRGRGWLSVIDDGLNLANHSAFKVAHHGSDNGYHDEIWDRLLLPNPFAIVTPYINGDVKLPTIDQSRRITGRTPDAYLTARPRPRRIESTNKSKERAVKEIGVNAYEKRGRYGHVCLRRGLAEPSWSVALDGDAHPLIDFADGKVS